MSAMLVLILGWPKLAGRAESQEGSVTAGSVSVQDNTSVAGHSAAVSSHAGEHASSKQRPSGRPRTAHSEAGSTDAASVQTMRGSEAVLGDVGDALGRDVSEVSFSQLSPCLFPKHSMLSPSSGLCIHCACLPPSSFEPCTCPNTHHACFKMGWQGLGVSSRHLLAGYGASQWDSGKRDGQVARSRACLHS